MIRIKPIIGPAAQMLEMSPEAARTQLINGAIALGRTESRANPEARLKFANMMRVGIHHHGANNFSLDYMAHQIAEKDTSGNFRNELTRFYSMLGSPGGRAESRAESANLTAMDRSQFADFVTTCVQARTVAPCPELFSDEILGCFGEATVACDGDGRVEFGPYLPDIEFGKCKGSDSRRDYYGVGPKFYGRMGGMCCDRFGFMVKRDMRCRNLDQMVMQIVRTQTRPQWVRYLARFGVALMLGGCCGNQCSTFDYRPNFMGQRFNTYSYDGMGHPLTVGNATCVDKDMTACSAEAFLCDAENHLEKQCHPVTGEQVSCCPSKDILMFGSGCSTKVMKRILKAHQVSHKTACTEGMTCEEERRYTESGRDGYAQVKRNPTMTRYAFEHLKKCHGPGGMSGNEWTDEQIYEALDRTMIIGCTQQVFQLVAPEGGDLVSEEWNAQGTFSAFDQAIDKALGYDACASWWVDPTALGAVHKFDGVPTGVECSGLCPEGGKTKKALAKSA